MKFTFAHNNFNVIDLDKSLKFYDNGSEVSRLSVAIQMEATGEPQKHHRTLNQ